MNWLSLTTEQQLEEIDKLSFEPPLKGVLLFKHSTRCSISSMALNRLDRNLLPSDDLPSYLIDLLDYRSVSQQIADRYQIAHESPQVLIIKNGRCIYNASHSGITAAEIEEAVSN
ncbi:MAG TPA: bacillithiol system redox-active protein YtxJ [Bacteroidia bacterium]|jgi:bacillithiol system protein YtxJ|nr:bacillithiol system redox-active protein YtxJ [Bacteroidia bacterium]